MQYTRMHQNSLSAGALRLPHTPLAQSKPIY